VRGVINIFFYFLVLARYVPNVAKWTGGVYDISVSNIGLIDDDRRPTSHIENFEWQYLRMGSFDPLHVWFLGGVFGVDRSSGAIFQIQYSNLGENNARGVIRLVTI